jgi:copper ion binding protein
MKNLFLLIAVWMLTAASFAVNTNDSLVVRIKGMRCEECAHKVSNVVRKNPGIDHIDFDYEKRTAVIHYDACAVSADTIKAQLARTGRYKTSPYDKNEVITRGMGLQMSDMHCQKCADRIMQRMSQMEGIDSIGPNLEKHYVFFRYDANKTTKAVIREVLTGMGFTPVTYYTSKNISFAYFNIPVEQVNEETIEAALALDGVDDANVCKRQKSLAITFVNTETSQERLLQELQEAGIKAVVPAPHECKE